MRRHRWMMAGALLAGFIVAGAGCASDAPQGYWVGAEDGRDPRERYVAARDQRPGFLSRRELRRQRKLAEENAEAAQALADALSSYDEPVPLHPYADSAVTDEDRREAEKRKIAEHYDKSRF